MRTCLWRTWNWTIVVAVAALGLATLSCKGDVGGAGDIVVLDTPVVATDVGLDKAVESDALADAQADAEVPGDLPEGELLADISPDPAMDPSSEVAIDGGSDAERDAGLPVGCDPEPELGSLWALFAPDRETAEQVPMCTWRGEVVLIVNTAAS